MRSALEEDEAAVGEGTITTELLARLDRIPVWPYPRRVLIIIGAGVFFAFFDIVTIAAALPVLVTHFDVSDTVASRTITSSLFGYIVGALIVSRVSDRMGRRVGLLLSVLLFSGGSVMTALSTELWHVIFWRFVTGMGIGSDIAGLTSYLGEVSPVRLRGRYTAIAVGIGFAGIAVVPFVAEALIPHFEWGWRALFLLGGVGGFIVAFLRRHLAPSPRLLVSSGRYEEAEIAVAAAEDFARSRGVTLPDPEPQAPTADGGSLMKPPLLGRALFFLAIWSSYYVGNYAWLSLMPELYVKRGLHLESSLWISGITSLGFLLGSACAVRAIDRVERKWACAGAAFFWSLLLLAVGWVPSVTLITIAGFFASASIAFFIPIMYTYTGENFPTPVRATSLAVGDGVGHLGGVYCAPIVLGIYHLFEADGHGYEMALTGMAATGLLSAILLLFGRSTKHLRL